MSEAITYQYNSHSTFEKNNNHLALAKYSENDKKQNDCFFEGVLMHPFLVSRCLITLSNIVQSRFTLTPSQILMMKDPIVTSGGEKIRFEGFSSCAGIYGRVDLIEKESKSNFLQNGTTNVDFNQKMISALGAIQTTDTLLLSVGKKAISIDTKKEKVVEKKVSLPNKWIKGLTTVQHYFSLSSHYLTLNRLQTLQLFKSIPKGTVKNKYYLIKRGNRFLFSPLEVKEAITIGGIHRLQLLTPLLPHIDQMKIYAHPDMQSVSFCLYLKEIVFTFSLSSDVYRGFSGEGALLEELLEDVPQQIIEQLDNYSFVNQSFSFIELALQASNVHHKIVDLTSKLSAMGMLGYELEKGEFFYRRLPFKLHRILTLNPRLKGVEKLLSEKKVHIILNTKSKVEASVEGSGVTHFVVLNETSHCTCVWFSTYQNKRGSCKHILAVKKMIKGA